VLSICIPTYNRSKSLTNCLQSIVLCQMHNAIQVCISDNASDDKTKEIVSKYKNKLNIKYHRFDTNMGRVKNYLNVINMADGIFTWLIGDDDLLVPDSIGKMLELLKENPTVDFFYVNSFNLSSEYVFSHPQPFDTINLPHRMTQFSNYKSQGKLKFFDLIDPKVSFDFVGAMFLAVFRKELWINNENVLNMHAVESKEEFSHFDNTFPHVKIFSAAFCKSSAYFYPDSLTVNLSGVREWSPMSPLINIVRLVESLDEYKKNGLPVYQYIRCKNYAFRTFFPDFFRLLLRKEVSGYFYIKPWRLLAGSLAYPNTYLSPIYYITDLIVKRYNFFSLKKRK
jgi:glycosyltransferase involved in cell wall biosynthesis